MHDLCVHVDVPEPGCDTFSMCIHKYMLSSSLVMSVVCCDELLKSVPLFSRSHKHVVWFCDYK